MTDIYRLLEIQKPEIVALLLSKGADPSALNSVGWNVLCSASKVSEYNCTMIYNLNPNINLTHFLLLGWKYLLNKTVGGGRKD